MGIIARLWTIIFFIFCANNLHADDWTIHIIKGSELQEQGKYVEAVREYTKAININPDIIEAYGSIGYIYQYELLEYDNAIDTYLKGLRHAPNDFSLNMNLMYLYFKMGKLEKGIIIYKKLATINRKNISYFIPEEIADKITKDMTVNEKINFCRKYLDINSSDLILRSMLADLFFESKSYAKAQNEYLSVLKQQKESESGITYFKLGVCEYYLSNFEVALGYLEKAKQLGQNVPVSYIEMLDKAILKNEEK